jgi:hypothetical protein
MGPGLRLHRYSEGPEPCSAALFKSAASRAGVQDSVVDAIQGHAGKSDADDYRHFGPPELFRAVASIPVPTIQADAKRPVRGHGGVV